MHVGLALRGGGSPWVQEALDAQLAATFGSERLAAGESVSLTEFVRCMTQLHVRNGLARRGRRGALP